METVLVTGSTGFIGKRLTEELIKDDYYVRLLVRSPEKAEKLESMGADLIEGDLTDPESVNRAMDGVKGVFHLAAVYELGGQLDWMRSVNVEGTRNILDAASENNVEKIVYCGSDTSLGNTNGQVCDETKSHDGDFRSNYARTKHEAHKLVMDRMQEGEPIVNAIVSSVYGAGDESPIATLMENHLAGHAITYLDGDSGYTFTHVDDVVSALKKSYETGKAGESYLISGTPATFEEFFQEMSEVSGRAEPYFELPEFLTRSVRTLLDKVPFSDTVREFKEMIDMGHDVTRFFSGEKARRELNWKPRSLKKGLRETLPWFEAKEAKKSKNLLTKLKPLLGGLAIFDLVLGSTALFLPDLYMSIMHSATETSSLSGDPYLLTRTGSLWFTFGVVQGIAALKPSDRAGWVMAAGVLRLLDVPADPIYYLSTSNLTFLGELGLLSAPFFNLITGGLFTYAGYRALRSSGWANLDSLPIGTN